MTEETEESEESDGKIERFGFREYPDALVTHNGKKYRFEELPYEAFPTKITKETEGAIERFGEWMYPEDLIWYQGKEYRFDELPDEAFAPLPEYILLYGEVRRIDDLHPDVALSRDMSAAWVDEGIATYLDPLQNEVWATLVGEKQLWAASFGDRISEKQDTEHGGQQRGEIEP